MIRNLLTAEAHRDPYVWAAVLLAHFAIGAMLWLMLGLWAAAVYATFELLQAYCCGSTLWWDSLLDWCGVALGVKFTAAAWNHDTTAAGLCALAAINIAVVGYLARS